MQYIVKKYTIVVLIIMATLLCSCSQKEDTQSFLFFGETEKWVVIVDTNTKFHFIYKGRYSDLTNDNAPNKISFAYGTVIGTTITTQELDGTVYFEHVYKDDFISDLGAYPHNTFNGNKLINVQIAYSKTTDCIDLEAYTDYKTK